MIILLYFFIIIIALRYANLKKINIIFNQDNYFYCDDTNKFNALIDRACRIYFIEFMSVADIKPRQSDTQQRQRRRPEEPNEPSGSQLILTDPVGT